MTSLLHCLPHCLLFSLLTIAFVLPSVSHAVLVDGVANATYDYIVVGCGIAGLVVSMRLSELPNASVLCIEAGSSDHYEDIIEFPVDIGFDVGGPYDWNLSTVPQAQLDNVPRHLPMGKVVGGGSVLNGMLWNRGNQDDYNDWAAYGNPGWAWNDMLPYFKKSETYTPIYYRGLEEQPVGYVSAVHGFDGPAQVSYPEYYWNQSTNWFAALADLGIPMVFDPNEGCSAGGYYIPSGIEPTNQTRSDARISYYDPYSTRPNFNLLDNSQVTRLIFNAPGRHYQTNTWNDTVKFKPPTAKAKRQGTGTALRATGVEFASNANAPRQTVFALQEVIIAAGAIHSPQILQLSGVGPAALLQRFEVEVVQNLVGVGNNLQDHCMVSVDYPYQQPGLLTPHNIVNNNALEHQFISSKTGPWAGEPSTAIAFPSLPQIINTTWDLVMAARNGSGFLPSTYDSTLRAGYEMQFDATLQRMLLNTTPAYEHLNDNGGGMDVALMHPLSRGTVQITSTDPFATPAIDPRWLINPFDMQVLIAAMQFNQLIIDTPPIQQLQPSYSQLPQNPSVDTLTTYIKENARTEFHYSGTCAMMPQQLGGVVDPDLLVYGTDNVRVVDTSIFPIIPAAHLQAVAYAVAEKAADIIKGVTASSTQQTLAPAEETGIGNWLVGYLHLNEKQRGS